MGFNINLAIIAGNVTREPELRYTPSGKAICKFSVATNHSVKNGDKWDNVPTYHNIIVWGKQGEYLGDSLHKGDRVAIQGRISESKWEKDGQTYRRTEIIADNVQSGPSGKVQGRTQNNTVDQEIEEPPADYQNSQEVNIDDIPF